MPREDTPPRAPAAAGTSRALAPRTNILPASNDRQFPALTHAKGPPHAPPVWSGPFSFWAFRVWGKSNTEVETTAPVNNDRNRFKALSLLRWWGSSVRPAVLSY